MSRDRSRYRAEVESALDRIRVQVDELRRFKTYGARTVALADRKRDLAAVRSELAELVSGRAADDSAAPRRVDVRPDPVEHGEQVGPLALVESG